MTINELYHHGILGMKWGVRRYQNDDGSLTSKGKERYAKVSTSDYLQKKDTRTAKKVLSKQYKENVTYTNVSENKATKYQQKANRLREYGSGQKDDDKALKYDYKADKWTEKGKSFASTAKAAKAMYDDIDSGKLKAGRDFIVQTDYNVWPIAGFGLVGAAVQKETRIVSKKS